MGIAAWNLAVFGYHVQAHSIAGRGESCEWRARRARGGPLVPRSADVGAIRVSANGWEGHVLEGLQVWGHKCCLYNSDVLCEDLDQPYCHIEERLCGLKPAAHACQCLPCPSACIRAHRKCLSLLCPRARLPLRIHKEQPSLCKTCGCHAGVVDAGEPPGGPQAPHCHPDRDAPWGAAAERLCRRRIVACGEAAHCGLRRCLSLGVRLADIISGRLTHRERVWG